MEKMDFTTLEAAMARDWLNMQIKIHGMQEISHTFKGGPAAVMGPDRDIHMPYGIDYITELLGLEMEETLRDDAIYPWEYSFVYNGTRFYQIEEERLGKYAERAGQEIPDGQIPADAGTV